MTDPRPIPLGGTIGVDPHGPAGDDSWVDPGPNPEGPSKTVEVPEDDEAT